MKKYFQKHPPDPAMKRFLSYSATIHGVLVSLILFGLIRPAPIRLGPVYGVDFMGNWKESGGGRSPQQAPAVETPAPEEKEAKTDESAWNLKRKKGKPKHVIEHKARAAATRAATKSAGRTEDEGEGTGIGIGLGPGMGAGLGGGGGFPYSWYLMSLRSKLWQEWSRWAGSNQPHNCVVSFSIGRDGSVSNVTLSKSSGDPFYDKMSVRVVSYAAPFPPLPEGFGRSQLDLIVEFKFLAGKI